MSTDAVVVRPDRTWEVVAKPDDEDWLRFLYRLIGTNIVEVHECGTAVLVVDEEGRIKQREPNGGATITAFSLGGRALSYVGTAVYIGGVGEDEFRGLSPVELTAVRETLTSLL